MTDNHADLCPVQQETFDWLIEAAEIGNILHVSSRTRADHCTSIRISSQF